MYTLTFTTRPVHALAGLLSIPRIVSVMKKIILWMIIVDIVLVSALYTKIFVFAKERNVVRSVDHNIAVPRPILLGAETSSFIQSLKDNNFNPIVLSTVKRNSFSVEGNMISLDNDNIQVYEYLDNQSALKDATTLKEKWKSSSRSEMRKKNMHMYVNDKLAIFYMGRDEDIVKTLLTLTK